MALKSVIGAAKNGAPPPQAPTPALARGLGSLLKHGLVLSPQREAHLKEGLDKGLAFYTRYNESRLELAFGSFDQEMRHALYEMRRSGKERGASPWGGPGNQGRRSGSAGNAAGRVERGRPKETPALLGRIPN